MSQRDESDSPKRTPEQDGNASADIACDICGLVNPGPEHRAYAPLLCAERRLDTGRGEGVVAAEDRPGPTADAGTGEQWLALTATVWAEAENHDRYGVVSIVEALDEALAEAKRAPAGTDRYQLVWGSFWDRLTDGSYIPVRSDRK